MCSWGLPLGLWEEGWTLSVGLSATVPKGFNGDGGSVPC